MISKTVEIDGDQYNFKWLKVNNEGFKIEREDIPNGITFCEGRKSLKKDEWSDREFYWCCNKSCFAPVQDPHHHFLWEDYTLQDFIQILNLTFDKEDYVKFLALLNRTNRLLERLKCNSCGYILRPAKSSTFAFYRVNTFQCMNHECQEYGKKIYLTHCLNWKCNGIIDSRVSAKCPNGWYICEDCGSCCSHQKLSQRLEHLKKVGAFKPSNWKHQKLLKQVQEHLGHEELEMKFDYRTGNLINNDEV